MTGSVRLLLERGTSKCLKKTLAPDCRLLHITVGSSVLADWRVHARGVRAKHAHFVWTGKTLRIEEQQAPGAVKVDGRPMAHRVEITASATLELGQAIIRVEWPRARERRESEQASSPTLSLHEDETRQWTLEDDGHALPGNVNAPAEIEQASRDETMVATVIAPLASLPAYPPGDSARPARVSRDWRRRRRWAIAVAVCSLIAGGLALVPGLSRTTSNSATAALAHEAGSAALKGQAPGAQSASVVTIEPLPQEPAPVFPAEAAEHLVRGRFAPALAAYRQLAAQYPEQSIYAEVARILERDIGERCAATGGGSACVAL